MDRRDFLVEIIRCRPQGLETFELGAPPASDPLDVTAYAELDGLSSINRAIDRDLLTMKTGDLTVVFDNPDGYFDDVFDPIVLTPTTIWSLRVSRDGEVHFWGVLIGKGSVKFNRKDRQCEVTAYGLTKLLDMSSADPVQRIFSAMNLTAGTTAGVTTTLTMNTTISLLSGDVLHISDGVSKEDVTVRQVLSSTQVLLEAAVTVTWAGTETVTQTTPWWRYKSISYLVEKLYQAAGVPLAELKISNSQFRALGPTPVNLGGLATIATTNPTISNPAEKDARRFETHLVNGTYRQGAPDEDWVQDDATVRPWVDWSRYFAQGEVFAARLDLRDPDTPETTPGGGNFVDVHFCGYEPHAVTPLKWNMNGATGDLNQRTNALHDGITWTARATIATVPGARWQAASTQNNLGCEVDEVRQQIYIWSNQGGGGAGAPTMELYSIGGGTFTNIRQADDTAGICYGGFSWVPELDAVVGLRSTTKNGPAFEIVAFRNGARLWKRPFPNALIQSYAAGVFTLWPTHTLRFVAGKLYCVVINDGKAQLVVSDDEFQTYTMRALTDPGVGPRCFASRVNDVYQITCYDGTLQRGLFIAAPFYAGVVEYADFEDQSVAEALKKLAILANAYFWIDDDLAGHFVARDLYDTAAVTDISDLLMEREDDLIWDQTAQFVTYSGGGFEAVAGDNAFAADGIELDADFNPTEAFAQAAADNYYEFFSQARKWIEAPAFDADGRIFRPLDRVLIDGERFFVYESDHDLASDEVQLSLLEDR